MISATDTLVAVQVCERQERVSHDSVVEALLAAKFGRRKVMQGKVERMRAERTLKEERKSEDNTSNEEKISSTGL